ncbi:hypothetical protein FisN_26Lu054 [Fistulifera solaris]|uniref:HMG box domain-containing protein n=1 Tax=Fistulifera solaris TaxID=1519565 RepID=A0A1Z5KD11_FISSO|nr:hypothetical protein FisN_26Lu054 [Fistulifera solaris]|eukprot:GAX23981.1 hypothetical protein FisN_26Lu054 [Fistulifera solaris]
MMNQQRWKKDKDSPVIRHADNNTGQSLSYAAPLLPCAASYSLPSYDFLLLSLANSNPRAGHFLSQQPVCSKAITQSSRPLFQDIPLQQLAALNSNLLGNPLTSFLSHPSLYQRPSQLSHDSWLPFHAAPPVAAHHFELTNSSQGPPPQIASLLPSAKLSLQNTTTESALVETNVENNPEREGATEVKAINNHDLDVSSDSIKSESIAKPKRNLSAYNYFFQAERRHIVFGTAEGKYDQRKRQRSGISFEDLAKEISERWRQVDPDTLQYYENLARVDKERYLKELKQFKQQHDSEMTKRRMDLESTVPRETIDLYMKSQGKKPQKRKFKK